MRFVHIISGWINQWFQHEEAIYLVVVLGLGLLAVLTVGGMLAPVIIALVFAYLLQSLIERLEAIGLPGGLAILLAFLLFLGAMAGFLLGVLPLVWRQFIAFINALPSVFQQVQEGLKGLPEQYPDLVSRAQVDAWIGFAGDELGQLGTRALELIIGNLPGVVGLLIYVVLVPILVFFFIKDRSALLAWLRAWLPESPVLNQVGQEMNAQIANYIRGKVAEILIVGVATWLVFLALGLNYAAFLAMVVGLSVIVPFVGAAVVTVPVALVGFFQFGWTWEFGWLMAAYGIIQALDGNVLVPLLFSEAVDLHPVAIIIAVLLFGGLWGFWGVFFAIPLATLIKAVINAWPSGDTAWAAPPADTDSAGAAAGDGGGATA